MKKCIMFAAATAVLTVSAVTAASAREPGIPASEKVFHRLDKNSDSKLQLDELMKPSERRFMRLDENKDGKVSSEEIDAWLQAIADRRKQRILKRMDKDGDGSVSKAEVDDYIAGLFATADADSDGGVTIDEARGYRAAKRKEYYDARKASSQSN